MMGMVKLNVKALKDAYAGKPAVRRRKAYPRSRRRRSWSAEGA